MSSNQNLIDQLRQVIKDAIDYFYSVAALWQARAAELVMSSAVFFILIGFSAIMALAAFLLLNVALGFWLTYILGSARWSIIILGLFYLALSLMTGGIALRWLNKLKS